jgi:ribosomal subunit interface protein
VRLPLQITFHNMDRSEAVEARIRERSALLERFFERIISCRVAVELKHRHQHHGRFYHVRIDLAVPGREIVVSHEPQADHAHEDVYVAVRDAFDALRRRLSDHSRRRRGDVKLHEAPATGTVAKLIPQKHCGFIRSADGEEIYFHRNSVTNGGFNKLSLGDAVRFVAQVGESDKGSQASTVVPLGKQHPAA